MSKRREDEDAGVGFDALADLPEAFEKAGHRRPGPPPRAPKPEVRVVERVKQYGKRANPDYKQLGVMIPGKLHHAVKLYALEHEEDVSDIVEEALSEYLEARR